MKFEKFALDTLSVLVKVKRWKNDSQRRFWQNCLSKYVFPKIGEKQVSEVSRNDLLDILEPIWETKTATASKLRGFLQVIFAYAIAEDIYKGGNPAVWQGNLEMKLPPVAKVKKEKHFKAMHYKELKKIFVFSTVHQLRALQLFSEYLLLLEVVNFPKQSGMRLILKRKSGTARHQEERTVMKNHLEFLCPTNVFSY